MSRLGTAIAKYWHQLKTSMEGRLHFVRVCPKQKKGTMTIKTTLDPRYYTPQEVYATWKKDLLESYDPQVFDACVKEVEVVFVKHENDPAGIRCTLRPSAKNPSSSTGPDMN